MASSNRKDILMLYSSQRGQEIQPIIHVRLYQHPKDSTPVMCIQLESDIYELQAASIRKHAAWFINQRVSSSSTIYMANKMDPRFLCLPCFLKSAAQYSPLNQIITAAEGFDRIPLSSISSWKIEEICDVNDQFGSDMILYRYNEEKTLKCLSGKVRRTAQVIAAQRHLKKSQVNSAFVSTFNVSQQSGTSANSLKIGTSNAKGMQILYY